MFKDFIGTRGVFTVKNLAVMGLLAALSAVLSLFEPYITPTFKLISLSFIPAVICSALFGPAAGLVFGFVSDFLGYVVKPQGGYFFGFAISAMSANLIYAAFLYRRPPSLWRVAAARLAVVLLVSLGLNGIWFGMMMGMTAGQFYNTARIIRNLIQYPFDAAVLYFLLNMIKKTRLAGN